MLLNDRGNLWILWPKSGFLYSSNEQRTGIDLLDKINNEIVQSLHFKESFIMKAKAKLQNSVKKVKTILLNNFSNCFVSCQWMKQNKKRVARDNLTESDLTVVGVHHRRTDHLDYERVFNIPHITMSYLGPSMDLFRDKFRNVVFVYVSDDKTWIKDYVKKDRDIVVGSSEAHDKLVSTGEDLALLSLCTHMITTRGTFSLWSARLTRGLVIRPCMFSHSSSGQEMRRRHERSADTGHTRWPLNPLHKQWQTSLWRDCE